MVYFLDNFGLFFFVSNSVHLKHLVQIKDTVFRLEQTVGVFREAKHILKHLMLILDKNATLFLNLADQVPHLLRSKRVALLWKEVAILRANQIMRLQVSASYVFACVLAFILSFLWREGRHSLELSG